MLKEIIGVLLGCANSLNFFSIESVNVRSSNKLHNDNHYNYVVFYIKFGDLGCIEILCDSGVPE